MSTGLRGRYLCTSHNQGKSWRPALVIVVADSTAAPRASSTSTHTCIFFTSSVGPTLLLAQAVRLLSVLAARSELQWLTLTSCSTLRDLSYTSSPSRIAKVWLKATLRVVISAQPCVPDMLVEVKSKIKLYATEHPGDRTAVDMIYYSLADHTDGRALVANASHTHPGGEKLVCQTDASPYVSSTPGSLSCRSGRFPWGTKGHLSRRLD
ncbi:unnamed protein product [Fusarium graminearum]|nr:unnamed protein product [Fusarium graminearum]